MEESNSRSITYPPGLSESPHLSSFLEPEKKENVSATDLTPLFCCNLIFMKRQSEWHFIINSPYIGHPIKFVNLTKRVNPFMPNVDPLSANPTKWSNILKQFVGFCRRTVWVCLTNCFSVFDHYVGLVLKGLKNWPKILFYSMFDHFSALCMKGLTCILKRNWIAFLQQI